MDGMKAYKSNPFKGRAEHLKESLKDYKSEDKTTKEEKEIRKAILNL